MVGVLGPPDAGDIPIALSGNLSDGRPDKAGAADDQTRFIVHDPGVRVWFTRRNERATRTHSLAQRLFFEL